MCHLLVSKLSGLDFTFFDSCPISSLTQILVEPHTHTKRMSADGAPYLRKCGNLSIQEIWVIMWPSVHPSAPEGNQCEMSNFLASVEACNLCLT